VVGEVVVEEDFSSPAAFDSLVRLTDLQLGQMYHSSLGESSDPVAGEETADWVRELERIECVFEVLTSGC